MRTKIVKRATYSSTWTEAWKTDVTPHYNRICDNIDRVGGSRHRSIARSIWSNPYESTAQD
jgi:hypothetical protein